MRPLTTILTLSVLALAGVVYMEMEKGLFAPKAHAPSLQVSLNVPASKITPPRDDEAFFSRREVGDLSNMVERPLFREDRRPPTVVVEAPPPVEVGPKASDLARYALVGTVITGDQQIALLRDPNGAALLELRRGDELHGWRVASMLSDTITFNADKQSVVIELKDAQ